MNIAGLRAILRIEEVEDSTATRLFFNESLWGRKELICYDKSSNYQLQQKQLKRGRNPNHELKLDRTLLLKHLKISKSSLAESLFFEFKKSKSFTLYIFTIFKFGIK